MAKLKPGEVLQKRYEVIEIIGSGGLSTVYLAKDLSMPKNWAVKEFSPFHLSLEEQKKAGEQFEREAKILSSLDHPGLPKVRDFFSEDGRKYIVMEYFSGKTLEEIIKEEGKPLPEKAVRKWAVEICEVLDYLHNLNPPVIHRDIKPQNLIINDDGEMKFIDFGIARIFNPVKKQDTLFMGTPGFASPEQFGRGQTDPRSDIFSLGATLHYLLSNHNPAQSPFKFSPVTSYNKKVSKEMEEIITKSVEIEPSHRFSSVKEIMMILSGEVSLKDLPSTPWPLVEPSEILLHNLPYKKVETAFRIKNVGGGTLKGQVKSCNEWIMFDREDFEGDGEEISLIIDPCKLAREEKHTGYIDVITRFMKKSIPLEVTFLPPLFKRLPSWAVCIILWLIPSFFAIVWNNYYRIPNLFSNVYYYRNFSDSLYWIMPSVIIFFLFLPFSYRRFYFFNIAAWLALFSYFATETLAAFILFTSVSIYFVFEVYKHISERHREELKIPLAVSFLLLPSVLIINEYSIIPVRGQVSFGRDVINIAGLFLITGFLIPFYYIKEIIASLTNCLNKSRLKPVKERISFLKCRYIYVILTGIIWSVTAILYADTGTDFRQFISLPWKITGYITHFTLVIPAKEAELWRGLPFLLMIPLAVLIYSYLRKYKYGKYVIYFSVTLIFLSAISIMSTYRDICSIKYIVSNCSYLLSVERLDSILKNDRISQQVIAILSEYPGIDFTERTGFLRTDDFYKKIDENLFRRLIFQKLKRGKGIKISLIDKGVISSLEEEYNNKSLSFERLEKFRPKEKLFNRESVLFDGNIQLFSDGEVFASMCYYAAVSEAHAYLYQGKEGLSGAYADRIDYLKLSLDLYEKINKDLYKDRVEEIKYRLALVEKYRVSPGSSNDDLLWAISSMHFDMADYFKDKGEKRLACIEIDKAVNSYNTDIFQREIARIAGNKVIDLVEDGFSYDEPWYLHPAYLARFYYDKALKTGYATDIYPSLAKAYFYTGRFEQAIEGYNFINKERELTFHECLILARSYYEENLDRKKALDYYYQALKEEGEEFPPARFYEMALCCDATGDEEKALFYYKRFLAEEENIPEKIRKTVKGKLAGKEKTLFIEVQEIHPDYIKYTFFMKNKPLDFLEIYEYSPVYDCSHTGNMEVKATSLYKDLYPFRRFDMKYLSPSDYSSLSFKMKNSYRESFHYWYQLPVRPEVDEYICVIAVPGDDVKIRKYKAFREEGTLEAIEPSGDWTLMVYDRTGCFIQRADYFEGSIEKDLPESSFIKEELHLTGITLPELHPVEADAKNVFSDKERIIFPVVLILLPLAVAFIWFCKSGAKYGAISRKTVFYLAPAVILYCLLIVNYSPSGFDYLTRNLNYHPGKVALLAISPLFIAAFSLIYLYIFVWISRREKQIMDLKIEKISRELSFFPPELTEEFFTRGGFEIKRKDMAIDRDYEDFIIESHKGFFSKYGTVPVRCYNIPADLDDRFLSHLEISYGKEFKDKLAIIVVPESLSLNNKFTLKRFKVERGLIIASLTSDDVKTSLFDEYSERERGGAGIRELLRNRISMAEGEEDLYYYTQKITDPLMFYGRDKIAKKIIATIEKGINTGIFGLRKIGKSSLNMYLQRALRNKESFYPLVLSLQRSTPTSAGIFEDIIESFKTEIKGRHPSIKIPHLKFDNKIEGDPEEMARAFKQDIGELKKLLPPGSRAVIFIDEIDLIFPEEGNKNTHIHFNRVFSILRGIGEVDGFFILVVQGFSSGINSINHFPQDYEIRENPVFQYFREINLSNMTEEESDSLVEGIGAMMGFNYTKESLEKIYIEAGGHPFLTRLLCSSVVSVLEKSGQKNRGSVTVNSDIIEKAMGYCFKNYNDYFLYLDMVTEEYNGALKKMLVNKDFADMPLSQKSVDKLKVLGIIRKKEDEKYPEISYNLYRRWLAFQSEGKE